MSSVESVNFSPDGKLIITGSGDGTTRLWDVATGKELASFISFTGSDSNIASATRGLTVEAETAVASIDGEWLSITPDGYYQASPRGDRYLNVRVNNTVTGIDSYHDIFYRPDVVQARLQGLPDPASKANVTIQQAAAFMPPSVTIRSPVSGTTTTSASTTLSVTVSDQNHPIQTVKVFVNGRQVGRDELARAVTGNQKTVSFELPVNLKPGNNRIEVVAHNGYTVSDRSRPPTEVIWNAPAGYMRELPNLWILAVGVNAYDNAGPRLGELNNLGFGVADAKGLIDSLKAQEGRRYAKVNSLLIADGEALTPTAANIRRNLSFLDQAGEDDVALLFIAGHGISAQGGTFFFLPRDAAFSTVPTSTTAPVVDASRAISGEELTAALEGDGARLMFIDACNSGDVDNNHMVHILQRANAFVFAASEGNQSSWENSSLGHGYFTDSIMKALGGERAALNRENEITVFSMSGFVTNDVHTRVLRDIGARQTPKIHSLLSSDFPMAAIRE